MSCYGIFLTLPHLTTPYLTLPCGNRTVSGRSVDEFYQEKLHGTRPVVVYVTGKDMCPFLDELTVPRDNSTAQPTSSRGPDLEMSASASGSDDLEAAASAVAAGKTPLVLMTLGWDARGSPFHSFRKCSQKVLELPEVVRWFVSHSQGDLLSPKVRKVVDLIL